MFYFIKRRSINIDVFRNPNNVLKGRVGNGHVRIIFQVKNIGPSNIYQCFYSTNNEEEVNATFELLFWRKQRHYGAYIQLIDAPHCLLQPAIPATSFINTMLDFPNAYQCIYILLK